MLPPSPILKANDLLISLTSGEIPVLLEATTHTCDSPLSSEGPPWNQKVIDKPGVTGDLTRCDESSPENRTRDETYIFAELSNDRRAEFPSDSFPVGRAVCGKLQDVSHPAYYDFLAGHPNRLDNCSLPVPGKLDDFRGSQDSQSSCPNATALSSTIVVPKEDLDGDQLPMIATFHTYSTLPTPTFAPPSPSPSADVISPLSSPTSRQRHRRPLERARAVRFPGRPRSPRLQVTETEAHLMRNTPPSPTKRAYSRWQLAGSAPATSSCTTDAVHPHKRVALPEEFSWLRHMIIEFCIDQEGFRAVRPCMQLIGYSPRTRSLHPYEPAENAGSDITAGVAEFMPTKREMFVFHYATLDSPPTLRMVSVAGDESRDYISRQATLSVKVNGVYTVLGTEPFTAPTLNNDAYAPRLQNARLRWKFDYLVSDRKMDGTGKILPGEKTLTPLTFSCSPYLFHPLQGRKAGLMHVMKKNLVPKLGSQKLEPPTYYPSSHNSLTQARSRHISTGRDAVMHARSHSDAFSKKGHYSLTPSPLVDGIRKGPQGANRVQGARRRRASSAGEDSLACLANKSVPLKEGMFPTAF